MAEVIGVRFKNMGKVYYFDPNGGKLAAGDRVVVETSRGVECGEVAMANRDVADDTIVQPLKKVIRKATKEDLRRVAENEIKAKNAFVQCEKKIAERGLEMKLVDVEYTFDNSKILFYFTADGRVDFRELVKDLAGMFRTRIELRQIGVRDEAKMVGGLGICGRPFCCSTFLNGFQPVSIKMAKEQGLSLNPVKISGTCGRLMCCLKYEQDCYEQQRKLMPKLGKEVSTPDGRGVVTENNILRERVKVRIMLPDGTYDLKEYPLAQIGRLDAPPAPAGEAGIPESPEAGRGDKAPADGAGESGAPDGEKDRPRGERPPRPERPRQDRRERPRREQGERDSQGEGNLRREGQNGQSEGSQRQGEGRSNRQGRPRRQGGKPGQGEGQNRQGDGGQRQEGQRQGDGSRNNRQGRNQGGPHGERPPRPQRPQQERRPERPPQDSPVPPGEKPAVPEKERE